MASLFAHMGLAGIVAASGAFVGGMLIIGLRMSLSKRSRARQLERIRQIGVIGAAKQALFDVPQPELDFSHKQAAG